ncbi:MAG: hypothetical protein E5V81_29065, partial [Mesorhizobium sp.]
QRLQSARGWPPRKRPRRSRRHRLNGRPCRSASPRAHAASTALRPGGDRRASRRAYRAGRT